MARPGDPDVPPAAGRGRLARLLPGRGAGADPNITYESAERQAVQGATPVEPILIVPAPLGRTRAKPPPPAAAPPLGAAEAAASATAPPLTAERTPPGEQIPIVPAPLGRPRPKPIPTAATPAPAATEEAATAAPPAPSPEPSTPPSTDPVKIEPATAIPPQETRPGIDAEALVRPAEVPGPTFWSTREAAAAPPSTASVEAVAPAPELPPGQAGPQRRQPGMTAPEELLQVPASAGAAADDFFDGLVRRVEGDR